MERIQYFINGLLPHLRSYTILQNPKTLAEAEQAASLKQATYSTDTTATAVNALLASHQHLTTKLEALEEKSANVAAYENSGPPNRPHHYPAREGQRNNFHTREINQSSPDGRTRDFDKTVDRAVHAALDRLHRQGMLGNGHRQGYNYTRQSPFSQHPRDRLHFSRSGTFGMRSNRTTTEDVVCASWTF